MRGVSLRVQTREKILKNHPRGCRNSPNVDPEFDAGLYRDEPGNTSSRRQAERKTQQLCRQVQRALNLALEDHAAGGALGGLFIEEVAPAPGLGRLIARVVIPPDRPVAETMIALAREAPRLRAEVAGATSRKRVPELSFLPSGHDGGSDD